MRTHRTLPASQTNEIDVFEVKEPFHENCDDTTLRRFEII